MTKVILAALLAVSLNAFASDHEGAADETMPTAEETTHTDGDMGADMTGGEATKAPGKKVAKAKKTAKGKKEMKKKAEHAH